MSSVSLASAITNLKAVEIQQRAARAVLAKSMEIGRQTGEAVVALIESAAEVQAATAEVSGATEGLGAQLDLRA